jgi:hypothetical protein
LPKKKQVLAADPAKKWALAVDPKTKKLVFKVDPERFWRYLQPFVSRLSTQARDRGIPVERALKRVLLLPLRRRCRVVHALDIARSWRDRKKTGPLPDLAKALSCEPGRERFWLPRLSRKERAWVEQVRHVTLGLPRRLPPLKPARRGGKSAAAKAEAEFVRAHREAGLSPRDAVALLSLTDPAAGVEARRKRVERVPT